MVGVIESDGSTDVEEIKDITCDIFNARCLLFRWLKFIPEVLTEEYVVLKCKEMKTEN